MVDSISDNARLYSLMTACHGAFTLVSDLQNVEFVNSVVRVVQDFTRTVPDGIDVMI